MIHCRHKNCQISNSKRERYSGIDYASLQKHERSQHLCPLESLCPTCLFWSDDLAAVRSDRVRKEEYDNFQAIFQAFWPKFENKIQILQKSLEELKKKIYN